MTKTYGNIVNIAENLGWSISNLEECGFYVPDGEMEFEFSKYSPAGEDFSFSVGGDCAEGIIDQIMSYAYEFDTEEHVKRLVGTRGAPNIKTLVKDADDIHDMLNELVEAFNKID